MVSGRGNVIGIAKIQVKIFNISKIVTVFVLDNVDFSHNFLVGLDLIKEFRLCQDENLNIFQKNSKKTYSIVIDPKKSLFVNTLQLQADLGHLDSRKSDRIRKIILKFNRAFAKDKFDVGCVSGHQAAVKLLEHRYIYRKPYRCNIIDQKEIESQIDELFRAGLIEESASPFASPVTLAAKKQADGSTKKNRLCIDYSSLNKLLVPESQPFPLIEDLIVKARDCHWYSVLDINSAFWSIRLREKDRYKTAFVTQTGHYNWKCLPFGLKTSPAIFQRILRNVLKRNDLDNFAVNYIDDILVFSKTFEEHLQHLEKLIDAVSKEGFKLSLAKCNFAKNQVKYLGHVIGNNLTRPIYENVLPVRDFPTPKNQKNVRQFLGKVNFYHSYIPNSSQLLDPLHKLLRKNQPFIWNDKCEKSFQLCKNYLCHEPCLAIYSPTKETVVFTDASIEGIGAVLKQRQEDGSFKPVAYFSKKLSEYQKKKKAIYLECLAIKEALNYWRFRLLGLNFLIYTDHKPLENMQINTTLDDELREMILSISHFNFKVKYMPGKNNLEADCLSRNPVLESTEASTELKVVNFVNLSNLIEDQKIAFQNLKSKINVNNKGKIFFVKCKEKNKVLITDEFCKELIKETHLKFGHIGRKQMELTLLPFFYNVNLVKLIKNFCQSCEVCIKNKTRLPIKLGHLSQLGPAKAPFEIMSLDTIGGFSGNNSTKKYIHLLVDHFTRYAFATTSSTQKSPDFIRLINLAINGKNKISTILADQYTGINSLEFKNFLKSRNIKLLFTAVDCAFSNGLNERLNQTLVNRLRCKVNENKVNQKKPWPVLFEKCLNEYNSTVHSSTRFTPDYLMFGKRESLIPGINVKTDLQADRQSALIFSNKNHLYNKKRFDKNKKDFQFQSGDMVYVAHGNSLNRNKLDEIRSGPFRVLRRLSNVFYEVDSGFQKKESNFYHISKLYPVMMD